MTKSSLEMYILSFDNVILVQRISFGQEKTVSHFKNPANGLQDCTVLY